MDLDPKQDFWISIVLPVFVFVVWLALVAIVWSNTHG